MRSKWFKFITTAAIIINGLALILCANMVMGDMSNFYMKMGGTDNSQHVEHSQSLITWVTSEVLLLTGLFFAASFLYLRVSFNSLKGCNRFVLIEISPPRYKEVDWYSFNLRSPPHFV